MAEVSAEDRKKIKHRDGGRCVYGWKIRSWVTAHVVPVFYAHRRLWAVLSIEGGVRRIPEAEARRMMRAAYGPQWDEWVAELPTRYGLEMTK